MNASKLTKKDQEYSNQRSLEVFGCYVYAYCKCPAKGPLTVGQDGTKDKKCHFCSTKA